MKALGRCIYAPSQSVRERVELQSFEKRRPDENSLKESIGGKILLLN